MQRVPCRRLLWKSQQYVNEGDSVGVNYSVASAGRVRWGQPKLETFTPLPGSYRRRG
jgi:hypothetical protein